MRHVRQIIRQQYIGVIALFLVLGGFAYAVSGQAILLGRPNIADKSTTVQNTGAGAVLDLQAKAGQPPLKVNSSTLVPKLNADQLDGKHASAFALAASAFTKAQSDARYARAGSSYTKAQTDAKYLDTTDVYTKAQSDSKYLDGSEAYTKAQADAAFLNTTEVYSQAEADQKFGQVVYSAAYSGSTPAPAGTESTVLSQTLLAPAAGMVTALLWVDGSSNVLCNAKVSLNNVVRGAGGPGADGLMVDGGMFASAAGAVSLKVSIENISVGGGVIPCSGRILVAFFPSA